MEGFVPQERLLRLKRNHPDDGQEDKSCRRRKRASENLIVMQHSNTEDEPRAGMAEEGASNCRQWIDLTDDISIIEETRGRDSAKPMQLGVSREEAGQDGEAQKKQVQLERLKRRPKATIASVDLTLPEPNATVLVETSLTNRADPVINTSEVLDLTTPMADLEVDLTTAEVDLTIISEVDLTTTSEVDLTTNTSEVDFTNTSEVDLTNVASLNNTLLCPVCFDPLYELDDGRYIPYGVSQC